MYIVYGENAIGERMTRMSFSHFKEEHFDISDTPRSGTFRVWWRSFKNINPQRSTSVYSRTGKCDALWQFHHCATFAFKRKVQKLAVWVLHALSQNHKHQRVVVCTSLPARHQLAHEQQWPFLYCKVPGDEKLRLYANIRKRKEWLSPNKKASLQTKTCAHSQKIILCIFIPHSEKSVLEKMCVCLCLSVHPSVCLWDRRRT